MLPKINLVGRLTREPEIKYLPSGTCVASFGIASSEKQKNKEVVCFIDCVVFGGLAEKVVQPYLKKGSQIYINGRLKLDQWQDQNGGKRSKHSVVVESMQMLGNNSEKPNSPNQPNSTQQYQSYQQPKVEVKPASKNGALPDIDIDEDEIPFSRGAR